jgi:hypothetical protein
MVFNGEALKVVVVVVVVVIIIIIIIIYEHVINTFCLVAISTLKSLVPAFFKGTEKI